MEAAFIEKFTCSREYGAKTNLKVTRRKRKILRKKGQNVSPILLISFYFIFCFIERTVPSKTEKEISQSDNKRYAE
jgi:hypothetical protein